MWNNELLLRFNFWCFCGMNIFILFCEQLTLHYFIHEVKSPWKVCTLWKSDLTKLNDFEIIPVSNTWCLICFRVGRWFSNKLESGTDGEVRKPSVCSVESHCGGLSSGFSTAGNMGSVWFGEHTQTSPLREYKWWCYDVRFLSEFEQIVVINKMYTIVRSPE